MKNIKNWLTRNDFKFEVIKLNEIEGVQNNAIMVSNDYERLHATKEVIENYKKISKYINRFQKDFTAEHVGSYTGVLIQPKTLDSTLVQATIKEDKINDLKGSEVAADPKVQEIVLNTIKQDCNIIITLNKNNNLINTILEENDINIDNVKSCTIDHLKGDRGEYQCIKVLFNDDYQTSVKIYKNDYINFIEKAEQNREESTENEATADTESNIKEIKESYNQFVFEINNKLYYIVFSGDGSLSISDYLGEEKINKHNVKINTENERKYNFDKSIYKNILDDESYRMNFIIKFLEENKIEEVENMKELNFRELEIIEDTPINCKYCKDFTKEELILLAKENNINIDKSVSKEYIFISVYNWIVEGDETQNNFYHVDTNLGKFIGTTDEKKEIQDLYNAIVNDSDFKNIQEFKTCENKLDVKIDNNWIYSYCQLSFDKNIKKLKSMLETKLKEDNKKLEVAPAQEIKYMNINKNIKNKILKICDILCHNGNIVVIGDYDLNIGKMYLCSCSNVEICVSYSKDELIIQTYLPNREHEVLSLNTSTIKGIKKLLDFNNIIYTQCSKTKSLNINLHDIQIIQPDQDTIKEEFKEVEKVDPTPAAEEIILNEDYQIHLKNRYEIIIKFLNDNNIKHEVIQPNTTHLIIKLFNISLLLEKGLEEGVKTWGKTSIFKSDLSILDKNLHYLNLDEVITYLNKMIDNTSLEVI